MEYRWVQTGSLQTEFHITSLSWNLEGTRLLTGGELLQLWHQNIQPFHDDHRKFINYHQFFFQLHKQHGFIYIYVILIMKILFYDIQINYVQRQRRKLRILRRIQLPELIKVLRETPRKIVSSFAIRMNVYSIYFHPFFFLLSILHDVVVSCILHCQQSFFFFLFYHYCHCSSFFFLNFFLYFLILFLRK